MEDRTFYGQTKNDSFTVYGSCGGAGFSFVYEIKDEDGNSYALKLPKTAEATVINSIIHEGNTLSQLSHENIVRLYHFHDGTRYEWLPPYLILEHCEDDLSHIIGKRKAFSKHFTNEEFIGLFVQPCRGMRLINTSFIHCDINPSNILIKDSFSERYDLKIADFGVSVPIGHDLADSPFRKYRRWDFAPPETWQDGQCTLEMDIYSMGLLFYETATLDYPFNMEKDNSEEAYREVHTYSIPPEPKSFNQDLDPRISGIIMRMIAKDPKDRFHSWDDVIEQLQLPERGDHD